MKVRIEIHLEPTEVILLDEMAKEDNRSRKNFCENEIRKLIELHKIKNGTKNSTV